jgi:hypothetical protein
MRVPASQLPGGRATEHARIHHQPVLFDQVVGAQVPDESRCRPPAHRQCGSPNLSLAGSAALTA